MTVKRGFKKCIIAKKIATAYSYYLFGFFFTRSLYYTSMRSRSLAPFPVFFLSSLTGFAGVHVNATRVGADRK